MGRVGRSMEWIWCMVNCFRIGLVLEYTEYTMFPDEKNSSSAALDGTYPVHHMNCN